MILFRVGKNVELFHVAEAMLYLTAAVELNLFSLSSILNTSQLSVRKLPQQIAHASTIDTSGIQIPPSLRVYYHDTSLTFASLFYEY